MIELNKRFSIGPDHAGWVLVERYRKRDKKGNLTWTYATRSRYYADLEQCCHAVLDIALKDCGSLELVLELIQEYKQVVAEAIEKHYTKHRKQEVKQ